MVKQARRVFLPSLLFACLICDVSHSMGSTAKQSQSQVEAPTFEQIHSVSQLLDLPAELKNILNSNISTITSAKSRAGALHNLLFDDKYFAIQYDNSKTKTAAEVYHTGSGNCLSLAALYVAAARHVGLTADFQRVEIPPQWESADQFNVVYGHTNVLVSLPGSNITVELIDIYSAHDSQHYPSKTLSDHQALASFYNNLGVEALKLKQVSRAKEFFEGATELEPRFSDAWINLGLSEKLLGYFSAAEAHYKKGYKLNKKNVSALNNLLALYRQTGESNKAEKISKKIERYKLQNPFYLAEQAKQFLITRKDLRRGLKYIKKAIKKAPHEAEFYQTLGQLLFLTKQLKESEEAMEKAVALSLNPNETQQRQTKLDAIASLRLKSL